MGLLSALLPGRSTAADPLHASGMSLDELRASWIAASWLLSYPTPEVRERAETIRTLALGLPQRPRDGLLACLEALLARPLDEVQAQYVDTFDTRRRGCLYLTYFSHGDTRRRGMALVGIKEAYREAGVEVGDDELPDHLPVVLEFAAAHDAISGAAIMRANRPGVELLRLHLAETGSPWHGAVDAVTATLPPLEAEDREAIDRLIEQGPEEENVGLDGYGGLGLDDDAAALSARTFAACQPDAGPGAGRSAGPVPVQIMRGPQR